MSFMGIMSSFRSAGQPAGSAILARRTPLNFWRNFSLKKKVAVLGAVGVAGFIVGFSGTNNIESGLWGAGVAASLALIIVTLLYSPTIIVNIFLIFGTIVSFPLLGGAYTASVAGYADPVGGSVALFIAYALSLFVALKLGRGRYWVSVLVLSLSLIFPGLVLLVVFPELGLNAARLSFLIVLMMRCGGFTWIIGSLGLLYDKIVYGRDNSNSNFSLEESEILSNASKSWENQAKAEKIVSQKLMELSEEYKIFHDVCLLRKEENNPIPHIVIGPNGTRMISSVYSSSSPLMTLDKGLIIPQVDVNNIIWNMLKQKTLFAKSLKVNPKDIEMVVVVCNDNVFESITVAAMDLNKGANHREEKFTIVHVDELVKTFNNDFVRWSKVKTKQTIRRANMKFKSAILPREIKSTGNLEVAVLDKDGNTIVSSISGNDSKFCEGDKVFVYTSSGVLKNLRFINFVSQKKNDNAVRVCSESDWEKYITGSKNGIRYYIFPQNSVEKVSLSTYFLNTDT
jgi:hypothetical protein